MLSFLYTGGEIVNKFVPFEEAVKDTDLFVLPEKIYNDFWKVNVGKPYKNFIPFSYNLLLKKPEDKKETESKKKDSLEPVKFISPENFEDFTYCKKRHFDLFFKNNYDMELYGKKIDPDYTGMKRYQDLMVYSFIIQNIPKGSKILDIGGGDSRILKRLKNDYECWNIDKLEGVGGGPVKADTTGFKLVRDYMGNFNKELPDNYFDLVMSISTLEHVPNNDTKVYENILKDINRVLKPGGYSLQLIDILLHTADKNWVHPILPYFFKNEKVINKFVPFSEIFNDPQLYKVSEKFYKDRWEKIYKKSLAEFGTDVNYSLLWRKPF
jgi:ubiquinone/menaquinone biosynthesis C-methylase UbiE